MWLPLEVVKFCPKGMALIGMEESEDACPGEDACPAAPGEDERCPEEVVEEKFLPETALFPEKRCVKRFMAAEAWDCMIVVVLKKELQLIVNCVYNSQLVYGFVFLLNLLSTVTLCTPIPILLCLLLIQSLLFPPFVPSTVYPLNPNSCKRFFIWKLQRIITIRI
jgi:hypothetical protein